MSNQSSPQIGQIVKILKGKDAGQLAVVVSIADSRFVYIADGDKRKFDQCKKKNLLHLEPQKFISSEVVNSLKESGRVTNGKLRYAVMKFMKSTESQAEEKGD
ncbi:MULTISPECIES: KOW domain-containing RNA-binding protein [Paenibacillus]|uniref:Ribosomal protein L14E/L6E/L27E n=1 Tax=Paenibacillus favisporus TaxID=221028 RepID=A0ABV2FEH0_9BACL|nr:MULTISPECIES: KOW domain-containing RNA-binding protein [Paenibacillus]MCM3002215.1 KOW domain-containing RNA-binding protein [Paenibacillus cellulositrophicus]RED29623.1 ribosomal protein L14E/L6E/L27E [Paenibacillus sp. VMFN-D1]